MPSIAELRSAYGEFANGRSDQELLGLYGKAAGLSPAQVAQQFNWKPSDNGQWGNRLGGSIDSYQSNLYGLAEAVTGADWARRGRANNDFESDVMRDRARVQGAVQSYKDIGGVGDALNYVGGLAVDSLPYVAEALVGGVGGRAAAGVLGLAGPAVTRARIAGGVAASYPSAVGDVLSNQRDQNGQMDLGSAAALGVPYAALNALGVEGAAMRSRAFRNGIESLDDAARFGGLKRAGATAALTGVSEGVSETGQEVLNQMGRMAVDPRASLTSPEALDRYGESFVGGFALGGAAGGLGGGWRRSEGWEQRQADAQRRADAQARLPQNLLAPRSVPRDESFALTPGPGVSAQPADDFRGYESAGPGANTPLQQFDLFNPDGSPTYGADLSFGDYLQPPLPQGAPGSIAPPRGVPLEYSQTQLPFADQGQGAQLSMPVGAPGAQADMFDPLMEAPAQSGSVGGFAETGPTDGGAPLFDSRPTSLVQTDYGLPQLRQRVVAGLKGRLDGWSAKFTASVANMLPQSPEGTLQFIADTRDKIERSKLSQETIDQRLNTLTSLEGAVMDFQARMADAQGQEAAADQEQRRALINKWAQLGGVRPAGPVYSNSAPQGPVRPQDTTEAEMRQRNAAHWADQERQFTEALADENMARSTPNEMDPTLVREARPKGAGADGQGNLFPRAEMRQDRGPRAQAVGRAGALAGPDMQGSETASAEGEQMALFGPRGGVSKEAQRTGKPGQQSQRTELQGFADFLSRAAAEVDAELVTREAIEAKPEPAKSASAPAPAKPTRTEQAAARRVDAVATAYENLRAAEKGLEAVARMSPNSTPFKRAQEAYWDAKSELEAAQRDATRQASRPAPKPQAAPAPAPVADPVMDKLAAELKRERTPEQAAAEKAQGKEEKAQVEAEELAMIQAAVDRYNAAMDMPSAGVAQKEKRTRALKAAAADLDGMKAEGATAKVRKAAKAAIDDNVLAQHLPGVHNAEGDDNLASDPNTLTPSITSGKAKTAAEALRSLRNEANLNGNRVDEETKALIDALLSVPGMDSVKFRFTGRAEKAESGAPLLGQFSVDDGITINKGAALEQVLHEIAHAASVNAINAQFDAQGRPRTMAARNLQRLYEVAKERAQADGVTAYGLSDIFEFVAEAFTSTNFQGFLAQQSPARDVLPRGKMQSLWDRLVDALWQLWSGYTGDAPSMLDQVLRVGSTFMTGPGGPGGGTFNYERTATTIATPKEYGRMEYVGKTLGSMAKDWRNVPGVLGWFSMRQLKEKFGDGKDSLTDRFVDNVLRRSQRAEQLLNSVAQVVTPIRNLSADLQRSLGKVMLEATMLQGHVDRDFKDKSNAHLTEGDNAEFDRIRAAYNALPKEVQVLYAQARDAMQELWDSRAQAKIGQIKRAYEPELSRYFSPEDLTKFVTSPSQVRQDLNTAAQYMNLPRNVRNALRSLLESAEAHYEEQAEMKGPYFPLVRFGDHVVVVKSGALIKARDALQQANGRLQELYDADAPESPAEEAQHDAEVAAARKAVQAAKSSLELLKGEQKHYQVTFFENRWEAEAYQKQLADDPVVKRDSLDVTLEQRDKHYQQFDSASPGFIRRLEQSLRTALPKADQAAVRSAVRDVYVRSLPDRAAMKSELRRLNVMGAKSTEMLRGFAARGSAHAHAIAHMEYDSDINDALDALRKSDSRDDRLVGEEFAKRQMHSLQPPERNKVFERLAQASHLMFLGLSPSYVLTNAVQPWVISLPIMSARHGWAASAKALSEASGEVMASMRVARAAEAERLKKAGVGMADLRSLRLDIQPDQLGKTPNEKEMLKRLFNDGLINITIEHDIGAVSAGQEENWFDKVNQVAATPAHLVEVVNRVATALAAFRLQNRKDVSDNDFVSSVKYATQVVGDTHLDYSAENAPRLMRPDSFGGLGRLFFQFKKYTQGMLYLNAKLLSQAFKGDPEARKAAAYMWGMTAGVAGATGLPLAGGVSLLMTAASKLWDDDDEPDLQQMAYNGMKDAIGEDLARLLVKGAPAMLGGDMSNRLGMGSLTNPGQFVDWSKDGRALWGNMLIGMTGPASAMMANWIDAASVASTDPVRAWQLALPKVFADPLKAWDRAQRGIVSRAGSEVVAQEEFNAAQIVLRGLGVESTKVSDLYAERASINSAKTAKDDVRKGLIRSYLEAKASDGDTGAVLDKIAAFNERNPNDRITMSSLMSSEKAKRDHRRELMVDGIPVKKRDQDVLDSVGR